MNGEWKQRWSDFGVFKKERLVRAKHDEHWTRLECIYAHYRRWSFLRDSKPRSLEYVEGELLKASKGVVQDFRGHKLFPCWINVPEKQEDDDLRSSRSVVEEPVCKGKVRTLRALCFRDVTVLVGAQLDWMEPNSRERAEMREARRRDGEDPAPLPLIVLLGGMRRFVDADSVEKIL